MGVIETDLIITRPPPSVLGIKECAGQRGMSTYGMKGWECWIKSKRGGGMHR
jgi:hypothetical protein